MGGIRGPPRWGAGTAPTCRVKHREREAFDFLLVSFFAKRARERLPPWSASGAGQDRAAGGWEGDREREKQKPHSPLCLLKAAFLHSPEPVSSTLVRAWSCAGCRPIVRTTDKPATSRRELEVWFWSSPRLVPAPFRWEVVVTDGQKGSQCRMSAHGLSFLPSLKTASVVFPIWCGKEFL